MTSTLISKYQECHTSNFYLATATARTQHSAHGQRTLFASMGAQSMTGRGAVENSELQKYYVFWYFTNYNYQCFTAQLKDTFIILKVFWQGHLFNPQSWLPDQLAESIGRDRIDSAQLRPQRTLFWYFTKVLQLS